MYQRAGGIIVNGKKYYWTNWVIDEMYLDQEMFAMESYVVPDEWLWEMLDDKYSAHLMPMPMNTLN